MTLLGTAISALCVTSSALAQCAYVVEPFPPTEAFSPFIVDTADDGSAAGSYEFFGLPGKKVARWTSSGDLIPMQLPVGSGLLEGQGLGIGEDGTVTGRGWDTVTSNKLVIWRPDGSIDVFQPIPGMDFHTALPREDGCVLGQWNDPAVGILTPYIYCDGELMPLPAGLAEVHGGFRALSPSGLVTGQWYEQARVVDSRPFLWLGGPDDPAVPLPFPPIVKWSRGIDVNALGHIALIGQPPPGRGGISYWLSFYWRDGAYEAVEPLPGNVATRILDANEVGQLLGRSEGGTSPNRQILWQNGLTMKLTDLVTFGTGQQGGDATAITENGTIYYTGGNGKLYRLKPQSVVPADIDINCVVDARDLELLFASWGATWPKGGSSMGVYGLRRADVNGDGTIDGYDLAEILGAWTG